MYQLLLKAQPLKQRVLCKVTPCMSFAGKNQGSVNWLKYCNESGCDWSGNYRKTLQFSLARSKEQPLRRGLLSSNSVVPCMLCSFKVWELPWASLETSVWWRQWRGWHCKLQFFPWVLCMPPPVHALRSEMVKGKPLLLKQKREFYTVLALPINFAMLEER